MAQPQRPDEQPFWLRDNFAPVFEERTEENLEVSGAIPPELRGRFFRNGSNPASGTSLHWFLGNGMIHGVELQSGRATWYRNRYVRTPLFTDPDGPGALDASDRTRSLANTHVIAHAGRILALEEGHFPWEISPELETLGAHDFDGKLGTAMTAHPKICAETGELLFFGYSGSPPYLTYHRVSSEGTLLQSEEIDVRGPTMMHDFNITRSSAIFMDLPMVFDAAAMAGGGLPIRWSEDYGARLVVVPREGTNADAVRYEIDPCYVFHPMNAYDDGTRIVIDVARFPRMSMGLDGTDSEPASLHRWIIDREAGKVIDQPLDDRPCEFPRVDDRVVGRKHRYGYVVGTAGGPGSAWSELHKYDLQSGQTRTHDFGPGHSAGEPVFVESPGEEAEDGGYVMTFTYDAAEDRSDLVILDAVAFDQKPVARIHLPFRVPNGFHGSWIPDAV